MTKKQALAAMRKHNAYLIEAMQVRPHVEDHKKPTYHTNKKTGEEFISIDRYRVGYISTQVMAMYHIQGDGPTWQEAVDKALSRD